jgi:hypothetical protein
MTSDLPVSMAAVIFIIFLVPAHQRIEPLSVSSPKPCGRKHLVSKVEDRDCSDHRTAVGLPETFWRFQTM